MGFIFESEIDQILHTVRGQTIGEEESITLRELIVSPIHPALKAYFRAEVESILEQERSKEVRSKRFSYSHPEVMSLEHQVNLLLIQHYQFTQEEFDRILDEAVHFQFNYLCRPQFTLLEYVVGDRRRVQVSEIAKKLTRCTEYIYFPELIRRYCEERGLAELTYEEFKALLSRIDGEVVSRHTSDELAFMTSGILTFVDFGRATPHDDRNRPTLPTNAAIVFFEDKGLEQIRKRLEIERDISGRDLLSLEDLTQILREVWSDTIDGHLDAAASPEPSPEQGEMEAPSETQTEGTVPDELPQAESQAGVLTTAPVEQPADPSRTASLRSLHDFFSKKEIKRFERTIFAKDGQSLREALDTLNECGVWEDASHLLDNIFVAQNVDPFSREAVEFTDKVYARYFGG